MLVEQNLVSGFPTTITLSQLPAASTVPNYTSVRISDVGSGGGSEWYAYNGEWYPRGGSCRLAASAVAVSVTGTTAKTTTATVSVPPLLGLNGRLRIHVAMSVTNNANAKNARIELGGQSVLYSTVVSAATICGTFDVANSNSATSQLSTSRSATFSNNSSQSFTATTADTTTAQGLVFSFTLASSADTATLESYTVEIIK